MERGCIATRICINGHLFFLQGQFGNPFTNSGGEKRMERDRTSPVDCRT